MTLTLQLTASLLQPVVGIYTDRHHTPYSLVVGMGFSLVGLLLLAVAGRLGSLLLAAGLVGVGSSVFHPESSRVARMASGRTPRHGAVGVSGRREHRIGRSARCSPRSSCCRGASSSIAWCSLVALLAMIVLCQVGGWYQQHRPASTIRTATSAAPPGDRPPGPVAAPHLRGGRRARRADLLQVLLPGEPEQLLHVLPDQQVSACRCARRSSICSSSSAAVAAGTILGGPIGDRFGRKLVIWVSILGVFPFTMLLPYASLFWTRILTVIIGLILASAFSAIVVYAQELVPGRVGMISGLFFGFAFGMGGLGAAVLGWLADATSIEFVYRICAFLPLIGILTVFLPDVERHTAGHH